MNNTKLNNVWMGFIMVTILALGVAHNKAITSINDLEAKQNKLEIRILDLEEKTHPRYMGRIIKESE